MPAILDVPFLDISSHLMFLKVAISFFLRGGWIGHGDGEFCLSCLIKDIFAFFKCDFKTLSSE
jgi:hypothetical protein